MSLARRLGVVAFAIVLASAAGVPGPARRQDAWTIVGPGGGGTMRLPAISGHRVVPDLADASKVYVTTFGGSVWHGPATGDPGAVEDVIPLRVGAPGPTLEE